MKFYDKLSIEDRKKIDGIIRCHVANSGIAKTAGLEGGEELIKGLIEDGLVQVCFTSDLQYSWLEFTEAGLQYMKDNNLI